MDKETRQQVFDSFKLELMNEKGMTVEAYREEEDPTVCMFFEHLLSVVENHFIPRAIWHNYNEKPRDHSNILVVTIESGNMVGCRLYHKYSEPRLLKFDKWVYIEDLIG